MANHTDTLSLAAEANGAGVRLHRAGRPREAVAAYTVALAADPKCADAYGNRAAARGELNDTVGAFADFAAAVRLRPDFADALNNRGTLRRDLGDLSAALADFDRALAACPDHADARANRAVVHHLRWDHAAAAEDLTAALAAPPGRYGVDARRHLLTVFRGDAFYHLGRTAAAMADYRTAFADRPAAFAHLVCRTIATTVRDHGAEAVLADCARHLAQDARDYLSHARRAIILYGSACPGEAAADHAACYALGDPADAPLFEALIARASKGAT